MSGFRTEQGFPDWHDLAYVCKFKVAFTIITHHTNQLCLIMLFSLSSLPSSNISRCFCRVKIKLCLMHLLKWHLLRACITTDMHKACSLMWAVDTFVYGNKTHVIYYKYSICIKIEFNSPRIDLLLQYGQLFIVWLVPIIMADMRSCEHSSLKNYSPQWLNGSFHGILKWWFSLAWFSSSFLESADMNLWVT